MLAVVGFAIFAGWKGIQDLSRQSLEQEQRIAELKDFLENTRQPSSSRIQSPSGLRTALTAEQDTTTDPERELARLEGSRLSVSNVGWSYLFLASLLYAAALVSSAMYWHSCLIAFGHQPNRMVTVACHVLGQVGKYVPGKAMVIVIRSSALHRHAAIGRVPAVVGVFVETLTMMACGATIAGIAVLLIPAPWWIRGLAVLLAFTAAIPTLPPLFHVVLNRLSKSRFGRTANFEVARYDWRLMLRGWAWMSLTWFLIGGSFWLISLSTPGVSTDLLGVSGFATSSATIALAMVAGFLSLIPGGAGVRELVITALLAPLAGTGPALIAAVIARMVFLIVECFASGVSWALLKNIPAATTASASPTLPSAPHAS